MKKNWILNTNYKKEAVDELISGLGVNAIIGKLLAQRGVESFDDAKNFFRPNYKKLHNPFLMKNMDLAVSRLIDAVGNKEKVLIYGDYDVDGTTSVALMYSFLKNKIENLDYYIPDRYDEGYGISIKSIDYASENKFDLIIALDCGIKGNKQIDYANEKDIDFIICDHHTPGAEIPKAYAILDPKQNDCEYPFKELSGCGVGFKLAQGYCEKTGIDIDELKEYLDLLVVSIASDIVPIIDENRILAFHGLQKLNSSPSIGLRTLIQISNNYDKELTINDIVFQISPRINAAGRIETGRKAVELLIEKNAVIVEQFARKIDKINEERKSIDKQVFSEALNIIDNDVELQNKKSTVVFQNNWHKGVVGIVASRLIEKYYKPTIVLTESNGIVVGSARSVSSFNIYNAIEKCNSLLLKYGGHKFAAGVSLTLENVPAFISKFEEVVAASISENDLVRTISVDSYLTLEDIDPKILRLLPQFAPFGPGNMHPIFITEKIIDKGFGKVVGKENSHLRLNIVKTKEDEQSYPAIAFNMAKYKNHILDNKGAFDICYSIKVNKYKGQENNQFVIKDISI